MVYPIHADTISTELSAMWSKISIKICLEITLSGNHMLNLYKRALGPWVAHLRMTDQWSGTICEILVKCIMRNNSVKLFFEFVSVVQEDLLFKRFLIWCSGSPPVWCSGTIYAILKEGIMGNIRVKLYGIWTGGSQNVV